jgi:hypothetical protein
MSSEKQKSARVQEEEKLYEPIKNELERIFGSYVEKDKKQTYQGEPLPSPEKRDVYLEITHKKISDILKRILDDEALYIQKVEGFFPDIMGFVRKEPSSPKELITVEVKPIPIKIKHIERAKTYQDVFNATYGLLVSSKGIPEEIRRFVLKRPKIRGNLIIAEWRIFSSYGIKIPQSGKFRIHPDFKPYIPEPFKQFAKPL